MNKKDFSKNMKFFNVPEAGIQSGYSNLTMRVFDVYANILTCMYITRFSGGSTKSEEPLEAQSTPFPSLSSAPSTPPARININGGERKVRRRRGETR